MMHIISQESQVTQSSDCKNMLLKRGTGKHTIMQEMNNFSVPTHYKSESIIDLQKKLINTFK